jgi:hypothetical protein
LLNESLSFAHEQIADNQNKDLDESIGFLLNAINTLSSLNKAIVPLYMEDFLQRLNITMERGVCQPIEE